MSDEANTAGYSQPVSMFSDEIAQLNNMRNSIVKKIQGSTGGQMPPSVGNAASVMLQHFDTAYLWLTQVEAFLHMNSAENVEAVAEAALARGDVSVLDGGQA